jgi:HEAT repeat protein
VPVRCFFAVVLLGSIVADQSTLLAQDPQQRATAASVKDLVRRLRDGNPIERQKAADTLAALGPTAKDGVPALILALDDESERVATAATDALIAIGRAIISDGIVAAKTGSDKQRRELIGILSGMYRDGDKEIEALLYSGADDRSERVRETALCGLAANSSLKQALPILLRTMTDDKASDDLRACAAVGLVRIGNRVAPDLPAFEKLFSDRSRSNGLRSVCLNAIVSFSEKTPMLFSRLQAFVADGKEDPRVRAYAVQELRRFPDSRPDAGFLLKVLKSLSQSDETRHLRTEILNSLVESRPAKDCVPTLRDIVGDAREDFWTRALAIKALGAIGPSAKDAVPTVIESMRDLSVLHSVSKDCPTALAEILGRQDAIELLSRFAADQNNPTVDRYVGIIYGHIRK